MKERKMKGERGREEEGKREWRERRVGGEKEGKKEGKR